MAKRQKADEQILELCAKQCKDIRGLLWRWVYRLWKCEHRQKFQPALHDILEDIWLPRFYDCVAVTRRCMCKQDYAGNWYLSTNKCARCGGGPKSGIYFQRTHFGESYLHVMDVIPRSSQISCIFVRVPWHTAAEVPWEAKQKGYVVSYP